MAFDNTYDAQRRVGTGGDEYRVLVDGDDNRAGNADFNVFFGDASTSPGVHAFQVRNVFPTNDVEVTVPQPATTSRMGTTTAPWTEINTELVRFIGTTSGTLTVTVPAAVTPHTLTLPGAVGAPNSVLSDLAGTGTLSWSTLAAMGGVTGSGVNGRVTFWTGVSTISSDAGLTYASGTDTLTLLQAVSGTGRYILSDGTNRAELSLTATSGNVVLAATANADLQFSTNGTTSWQVRNTGEWQPVGTTNTRDIGLASASVRRVFTNAVRPGTALALVIEEAGGTAALTVAAGGVVDANVGLEVSDLTSTRVVFTTTGGRLTDSANLFYTLGTETLSVNTINAVPFLGSPLTLGTVDTESVILETNNVTRVTVDGTGDVFVVQGLNVGGSANPTVGDGIFTGGMVIGADAAPAAGQALRIVPAVQTTGTPVGLLYTGAAHTNLIGEAIDGNFDASRTVTVAAASAPALWRVFNFEPPSIQSISGQTIARATTVYISGFPSGGGAGPLTITNSYALLVATGKVVFNDDASGVSDVRIEGASLSHLFFTDAAAATENIGMLASGEPNWQTMDRGLFIGNATTVPTGNPTSGIFMYVESGDLKVRLPGGDIIVLAQAA